MAARRGAVSVEALARRFGVSDMTIRRDLAQLTRSGRLSRTHGGATLSRAGVVEFAFQQKEIRNALQKRAIARAIFDRLEPGMSLSLDTGTTTLELARLLPGRGPLTVLTTSLAVASVLHSAEDLEVVLLGGTMRKRSPDLSGALTEDNLKRFRVDLAVIGADAVLPEGTFTTDVGIAEVTRAMAANAQTVILAADSSKFSAVAFCLCLELAAFDLVVTDDGCPDNVLDWLAEAGRRLHVVTT